MPGASLLQMPTATDPVVGTANVDRTQWALRAPLEYHTLGRWHTCHTSHVPTVCVSQEGKKRIYYGRSDIMDGGPCAGHPTQIELSLNKQGRFRHVVPDNVEDNVLMTKETFYSLGKRRDKVETLADTRQPDVRPPYGSRHVVSQLGFSPAELHSHGSDCSVIQQRIRVHGKRPYYAPKSLQRAEARIVQTRKGRQAVAVPARGEDRDDYDQIYFASTHDVGGKRRPGKSGHKGKRRASKRGDPDAEAAEDALHDDDGRGAKASVTMSINVMSSELEMRRRAAQVHRSRHTWDPSRYARSKKHPLESEWRDLMKH